MVLEPIQAIQEVPMTRVEKTDIYQYLCEIPMFRNPVSQEAKEALAVICVGLAIALFSFVSKFSWELRMFALVLVGCGALIWRCKGIRQRKSLDLHVSLLAEKFGMTSAELVALDIDSICTTSMSHSKGPRRV